VRLNCKNSPKRSPCDFLLHDVGTGDRTPIALVEHFGRERVEKRMREPAGARAAEKEHPPEKTEDECSESYQTAVLEREKHPDLLRDTLCARNKLRTAPLWGLRVRSRLMHDGASVELGNAIRRHRGRGRGSDRTFLQAEAG